MSRYIITLLAVSLPLLSKGFAEERSARAVRRSDVVFMYDNPTMYEPYGCTVLGWAGRANRQHIEQAHASGVRQFAVSVGFRTEFRGMIDFSDDFLDAACLNFAGKPFIVPWLWDHKYQDQPAWHWCTNSPLYRKFLASRLEQRMTTGCDGLHIDDYTGTSGMVTWQSACFCTHCMTGFREYLADHISKDKRSELGIDPLDRFDYRQFLLDKGVRPEDYNRRRASLPLAAEFLDYQVQAANRYVGEYRRLAEKIRDKPLTLSVNSSLTKPETLVITPQLSHFCCEVWHGAAKRATPTHPIYIYKLADGLNRPVMSTASGHDWHYISEHRLHGLVRSWTALSYAYGHTFMAPHRQWCYDKQVGTHWYDGPTDEYAWPYKFVRRMARLLDRYEAVAPVGVLYDNAARRRGKANIEPLVIDLATRNVPFSIVIAGDDWLEDRLDPARLKQFQAVLVPKDLALDEPQRKMIEEVRQSGRLVEAADQARLDELVPTPIAVIGSEHVGVVPRAIPGDATAPIVIHLLNRQYDAEHDRMTTQRDFTVRIHRDLFGDRKFHRATAHAPKQEPRQLELTDESEHFSIKIPELDLWTLVEIE